MRCQEDVPVRHGHRQIRPDRILLLPLTLPGPPPTGGVVTIRRPGGLLRSRRGLDRLPDHMPAGLDLADIRLARHPLGDHGCHGFGIAGLDRDQHPLAVWIDGRLVIGRHRTPFPQMLDQVASHFDLRTIRILFETRDDILEHTRLTDDVVHEGLHRIKCVCDIPLE